MIIMETSMKGFKDRDANFLKIMDQIINILSLPLISISVT